MRESMKAILLVVGMVCAFQALKLIFGVGVSLAVALAALSFCIGAFWGAGNVKAHPSKSMRGGE